MKIKIVSALTLLYLLSATAAAQVNNPSPVVHPAQSQNAANAQASSPVQQSQNSVSATLGDGGGAINCDAYAVPPAFPGGCDSRPCGPLAGGCDQRPCGPLAAGCDTRGLVGKNYFRGGCDAPCDGGCDSGCQSCVSGVGCLPACYRYSRAFGGWNEMNDVSTGDGTVTFNDGWMAGFALGTRSNCRLRTEVDFTYRNNTYDEFISGSSVTDTDGNINVVSSMGNVLFDFNRLQLRCAHPYVGAGVGAAYADVTEITSNGTFSANDYAFAYQFIGGLDRPLSRCANAFVEYRYFRGIDFNFGGSDFDYVAHNLLFGIQIRK